MKLRIDSAYLTEKLKRAILTTGAAVNPVHKLVKLEAKRDKGGGDVLTISSTAGLLALTTAVSAEVLEPGIIATNTRDIANAASAMPLGPITITLTGDAERRRVKLTGSSGRSWTAPIVDHTNLQPVPEPVQLPWLRLPTAFVTNVLERVTYPLGSITENERGWDGLRIEATATSLRAVCVSRHQFAIYDEVAAPELSKVKTWTSLIASNALGMLRDLVKEANDDAEEGKAPYIDLHTDERFVYMLGPHTLAVASLPVGDYPPYELLLQGLAQEPYAVFSRLASMESIKAALATRSSDVKTSSLAGAFFTLEGSNLIVSQKDSDHDFHDAVPTINMRQGLKARLKASLTYMLDALKGADVDPDFVLSEDGSLALFRTRGGYRAGLALMDQDAESQ